MSEEKKDSISTEELRHILEYVCGYISNCDNLPNNNGYYKESIRKMCHNLEEKRPEIIKETLKIDFGLPKEPYCTECGKPIDIIEYMARRIKIQNGLCFICIKKLIKDELD